MSQKWQKALRKVLILMLWTGMLSFVLIALAFSSQQAGDTPCKKVDIAIYPIDIHFYNRQRVLELLRDALPQRRKLIGMSMGEIDQSKLEQKLKKELLIEDAEVYTDLEGTVHVRVQQRKPLIRLIRYDGTQFYLDQYGVKIPLSEHYTARVPLANGNIFERFEKRDSVYSFVGKELFIMASYVDKHPFYKALIEQIFVRADNELILVPKIGSRFIIFGDAQNPEKKFRKLMVFYREGLSRIGWNHYASIDLRFEGQVICKK